LTTVLEALQSGWVWSVLLLVAGVMLAWFAARLWLWLAVFVPLLIGLTLLGGVATPVWITTWLAFAAGFIVLGVPRVRTGIVSEPVFQVMRQSLPSLSDSERETIEAGGTGWESSLFAGRPDWRALRPTTGTAPPDERERAFIDGPVEEFCTALDDYRLNHIDGTLPDAAWRVLRRERMFGLNLPESQGGPGLSPCAQSAALVKIASRSISAALVVMVPSWGGPIRLLERFGTEAQRQRQLPAMAAGDEIPCLALTGPESGSDAASITDHGIVCRRDHDGHEDVLGVSLNFDKRYISLAPAATLIVLAFKLDDPGGLLGIRRRGMTLALVPADAPGVTRGARHDVQQLGFPVGPIRGHEVFVPLDAIVGGAEGIGRGWAMLAACQAEARCLAMPALSCAAAKMAARLTGAYARVRYQFRRPISRFEGIQEALAIIAGNAFAMEATRQFVLAEIERGEAPAVAGAIAKYNLTERCRTVCDRAMDVYAGAGLCLGPRNLIGEIARFPPVGVTAQGPNLLTRNLVTFGLGVIRCHPSLRAEIDAASMRGRAALIAFDKAFARHLRHAFSNLVRTVLLGLTGSRLASAPRGSRPNGRYYRQLARLAAAFALTTDVVLFTVRGELRRRERLAGRMADVLSELYIGSAVLRHHALSGGRETGDRALLEWAMRDSLVRAETALEGVCQNLPVRWVGPILRRLLFPLGRAWRPVGDDVEQRLAEMLTVPSTARDRLTAGIFQPLAKDEPLTRLETALSKLAMTADLEAKLRAGAELELLGPGRFEDRIKQAVTARLLSPAEGDELLAAEAARREALRVDAFWPPREGAAGDE
jgi:acyl-CoA dehydrogenase